MEPEKRPRIRVGVIVCRDENILLVCHRKGERRYWMLPGGGLKWGETLTACGEREVREETGLQIEAGRLLFVTETIDPSGSRHIVNMVILGTYRGGNLRCPTEEIIETVEWFPIRDLPGATLFPPIGSLLYEGLDKGFPEYPVHLGSLWAD